LLAHTQQAINRPALTDPAAPQAANAAGLHTICELLQHATGHDFRHYKPATLLRRIDRRMQVAHIETFDDYVERLRQDRQEIDQLFQDLLISVTHFFRDEAAFAALASTVIPKLFQNKGAD